MKTIKKRGVAVAVTVAVAVLLLVAAKPVKQMSGNSDFNLGRDMEILFNTYRDLSLFYVDSVSSDKLLSDAAEGMTGNLDPYTEYMPEEEMADFEILTTGKYGGIGALIRKKGDYVVISQPYEHFPADKAGLQVGDKILEIDGRSAKGFDAAQVSALLKGDPGTKVNLKVEKFYTGETVPVPIRRERIVISGVPYHACVEEGIGYIQHTDFTEDCSDDMRRAIVDLKKKGELKGLILDLRNNGGGLLQEAVKIVGLFVPKGTEVVSMRGRHAQLDMTFRTENEPAEAELPVVVLINSSSASASEIVAGAIQDLDRGVLLGQRSFGKGLVQSTRPVGYNAYLKLTTAKYYTPSGRCIQAIDYAHRNEDGSVGYVPDSLIAEFTTRAGRKVYDGGGVMPDVKVPAEYASRFLMILYTKGYLEDFVDEYLKRHPGKVDSLKFRLTDADYEDFMRFMEDRDVEFESESKQALADLRKKATEERYINRIADDLDRIANSLKDDKNSNLKRYRNELTEFIEDEIIQRQYYASGQTRYRLERDREVAAAVELLRDTERYRTILTSGDTSRK